MRNHKVVLARSLAGVPVATDFRVVDEPLPEPGEGEMLVRHIYLSLDPYQRSAMSGRIVGDHASTISSRMLCARCTSSRRFLVSVLP